MAKRDNTLIKVFDLNKMTDAQLRQMENRIAKQYATAYKDLKKQADDYFKKFEKRDKEYLKKLQNGTITPPAGKTIEQHYAEWREAQLGRGERWNALRDNMANRMTSANQEASAYINDKTPEIYSMNANYTAYQIEKHIPSVDLGNGNKIGGAFDLVDAQTIKNLNVGNNQSEFKVSDGNGGYTFRRNQVNPKVDYNWNSKKIHAALTQGILQGQDINQLSKAFYNVMESNYKAAVRNARTSVTSAQNAGRNQTYAAAAEMGIQMQKEWIATIDNVTRDSHAELDGVRVDYDEAFPNGLQYPGDTAGDPAEVYNCRCTMSAVIAGTESAKERESEIEGHEGLHTKETYNEWLNRKQEEQAQQTQETAFVNPLSTKNNIMFVQAKTRAEAEQFAADNLADDVNYTGLSVDNANKINAEATRLMNKYGLDKLGTIVTSKRERGVMNANHAKLGINPSKVGKTLTENSFNFQLSQAMSQSSMRIMEERWAGRTMPPAIQKSYDKLKSDTMFTRYAVCDTSDDPVTYTVTHEFGHVLSDQYFGMINKSDANPNWYPNGAMAEMSGKWGEALSKAVESGDIYSISKYASTNSHEFFAEVFSMYEHGEKLPDYVVSLMEETLKNGFM